MVKIGVRFLRAGLNRKTVFPRMRVLKRFHHCSQPTWSVKKKSCPQIKKQAS